MSSSRLGRSLAIRYGETWQLSFCRAKSGKHWTLHPPILSPKNGVKILTWIGGRHGGVEKKGLRKTPRRTPLPKRGFEPPPLERYILHPAGCRGAEALLAGLEIFREVCSLVCFPPPYVLHPPPLSWPNWSAANGG